MGNEWGRTVVLVRDQDAALRFYREAFGARVIHDSTDDGFRYLHLSIGAGGLWLIPADPGSDDTVGRQTGAHPLGVIYVDDLELVVDSAVAAGSIVLKESAEDATARFVHVSDVDGNELVLVQLLGAADGARHRTPH